MIEYEFSEHALDMLKERRIHENWVRIAIEESDTKEQKEDGTLHFLKVFEEFDGRVPKVVLSHATLRYSG
jgi:uncharacterized protein YchJ